MHFGAMLVGTFLKAAEMGTGEMPAQPTFTISRVALEKLESIAMNDTEGAAGKMKTRGIIYFKDLDRGWVLNRTNIMCLVEMWGTDTDGWLGKRVTLYAADVRVGAKMDIGIRIKGSPDIDREINVSVKLPRRKPIPMKMVPTGQRATPELPALLLAGATDAAAKGEAAYDDWIKTLTSPDKAALKNSGKGAELRAVAKAADSGAPSDTAEHF